MVSPLPVIVGEDVILQCQSDSTSLPKTSVLQLGYNILKNGQPAFRRPTKTSSFIINGAPKTLRGERLEKSSHLIAYLYNLRSS